jgi:hypothetical protein
MCDVTVDTSSRYGLIHSPAPCGRGRGGGVCARQRAKESIVAITPAGLRCDSCAPTGAKPRPLTPAHKGRGNAVNVALAVES